MINSVDDIQINFNSDNLWAVNLTLSLIMFGVALDIKMSDFTNLLKSPKPVIVGIISQFILIPLVTFLIISQTCYCRYHFSIHPDSSGYIFDDHRYQTLSKYRIGYDYGCGLSWREYFKFYDQTCRWKCRFVC